MNAPNTTFNIYVILITKFLKTFFLLNCQELLSLKQLLFIEFFTIFVGVCKEYLQNVCYFDELNVFIVKLINKRLWFTIKSLFKV